MFLDHENSFDVGLAVANGLNADEDDGQWVYKQPDTFEDSVELIGTILKLVRDEELIPETAPICIVADSLASMVPNSKAEKFDKMAEGTAKDKDQLNMNDNTALARATSANFPTLALWARKYNACIIFLNGAYQNWRDVWRSDYVSGWRLSEILRVGAHPSGCIRYEGW